MKFIVDAHLPRRMVQWLSDAGCDALHTLDLPDGNSTTDRQIIELADREGRIVVTKDSDFVDSHLLAGEPKSLLLISTGNVRNSALESLMKPLLPTIIREFASASFLELNPAGLVVRS